ncbi:MAG: hypothetical protein ACKVP7_09855 [Hyphomicrobiaceae bacterium]
MSAAGANRANRDVKREAEPAEAGPSSPEVSLPADTATPFSRKQSPNVSGDRNSNKPRKAKVREAPREDWVFDPQVAVDLVFGQRGEAFPHQLSVYSYLLLVWMISPNSPTILRGAARSVALRVSFLKTIRNSMRLGSKSISTIVELSARLNREWYRKFHEYFVTPVDGFRAMNQSVSPINLDNRRVEKMKSWRAELELLGFLEKSLAIGSHDINRPLATNAVRLDYSRKGHKYYGLKRKTTPKVADRLRDEAPVMGASRADEMWTHSSPTMALLYCADGILGESMKRRYQKADVFTLLHAQGSLHAELRAVLSRYENLMRGLEVRPTIARHVARWRVVRVTTPDEVPMARFTNEEANRVEELHMKFGGARKPVVRPSS